MSALTWRARLVAPWLGRDGKLSRTMVVMTVVLGSYATPHPIPELLGIVAIVASHGLKPLMAWISRSSTTLATSTSIALTRGVTAAATVTAGAPAPPANEELPG